MSAIASYNHRPETTLTPQQFQVPIPPSPSRSPQPPQFYDVQQTQPQIQQAQQFQPQQQQQQQYHQANPGQSNLAPPFNNNNASSSNDKMQANLAKVQAQLTSRGGKYGAWASSQLQTQVDALKKVPITGDVNSNGNAIVFHVFKAGGLFSKDDVVTSEDRNTPVYYLNFPRTYRNSWNLTLYHHSSNGPLVANLTKGSYGFTMNDIEIVMSNGFKTILTKPSLISKNHQFIGLDGVTVFKWRKDGMLASTMTLQNLSNGEVVGTWEHSYSYGKDGKLLVSPKYNFMLDLIVCSSLAMEEWRREEEQKGGGSTSKMNLLRMGMAKLK